MNFKYQNSPWSQHAFCLDRDFTVEEERIFIGNEEGRFRFMLAHLGSHLCLFAQGDIGGIGNDQIKWLTQLVAQLEGVSLNDLDLQVQGICILLGGLDSDSRSVERPYLGWWKLVLYI